MENEKQIAIGKKYEGKDTANRYINGGICRTAK